MTKANSSRGGQRSKTSLVLASVIAMSISGTALADTTDQLLDQLKAKGILTKAEYQKLKARHQAELEQKATEAPAPAGHRLVTKEGVVIVPEDRYLTRLDKGIGAHIGAVDVKLSGELIFFGSEQFKQVGQTLCGPNPCVAGGLGGSSTVNNSNSIRSGLLPSSLVLNISTNQLGYDIGFTLGLYTGGNSANVGLLNANNGGAPFGLSTPGIDLRQVFGTIGTPEFGTVKIGRDLGLFGADAILNDFTLFGVGTPSANAAPANTSLGRIGIGYVYADWIPQVTYTTPNFYGFTASIGAFTPYNEFNVAGPFVAPVGFGVNPFSGTMSAHDQPQIQARLKYVGQLTPDLKLTAWTDGITQQHRAETEPGGVDAGLVLLAPGTNTRAFGVDGGARLDWGPVSVAAYGYYGAGLGTTGLFWNGISFDGNKRLSSGFYAEGEYTFYDTFTLGASYGASYLRGNWIDYSPFFGNGQLVGSNSSVIGFGRYKLTDWVSFQGEYIHSLSRNLVGGGISSDAFVLGTTFFF